VLHYCNRARIIYKTRFMRSNESHLAADARRKPLRAPAARLAGYQALKVEWA
jgi:hypothetical protein